MVDNNNARMSEAILRALQILESGESVDLTSCSVGQPSEFLKNEFISIHEKYYFVGKRLHYVPHKDADENQRELNQKRFSKTLDHIHKNSFSILKGNAGCGKTTLAEELANLYISGTFRDGKPSGGGFNIEGLPPPCDANGFFITMTASPYLTEERLFEFKSMHGNICLGPVGFLLRLARKYSDRRYVFILNEYNRIPHFLSTFGRLFESDLHGTGPNAFAGGIYANEMVNLAPDGSSYDCTFSANFRIILTQNSFEEGYRSVTFDLARDKALDNNRLLGAEINHFELDDHRTAHNHQQDCESNTVTKNFPGDYMEQNFDSLVTECCEGTENLGDEFLKSMKQDALGDLTKDKRLMPAKKISRYYKHIRDKYSKIYENLVSSICSIRGADYAYPIMIILSKSRSLDFTQARCEICDQDEEYQGIKKAWEEICNDKGMKRRKEWLKYIPCFPVDHEVLGKKYDLRHHIDVVSPKQIIFASQEAKRRFDSLYREKYPHNEFTLYTLLKNGELCRDDNHKLNLDDKELEICNPLVSIPGYLKFTSETTLSNIYDIMIEKLIKEGNEINDKLQDGEIYFTPLEIACHRNINYLISAVLENLYKYSRHEELKPERSLAMSIHQPGLLQDIWGKDAIKNQRERLFFPGPAGSTAENVLTLMEDLKSKLDKLDNSKDEEQKRKNMDAFDAVDRLVKLTKEDANFAAAFDENGGVERILKEIETIKEKKFKQDFDESHRPPKRSKIDERGSS